MHDVLTLVWNFEDRVNTDLLTVFKCSIWILVQLLQSKRTSFKKWSLVSISCWKEVEKWKAIGKFGVIFQFPFSDSHKPPKERIPASIDSRYSGVDFIACWIGNENRNNFFISFSSICCTFQGVSNCQFVCLSRDIELRVFLSWNPSHHLPQNKNKLKNMEVSLIFCQRHWALWFSNISMTHDTVEI